jgi:hypothetical protein
MYKLRTPCLMFEEKTTLQPVMKNFISYIMVHIILLMLNGSCGPACDACCLRFRIYAEVQPGCSQAPVRIWGCCVRLRHKRLVHQIRVWREEYFLCVELRTLGRSGWHFGRLRFKSRIADWLFWLRFFVLWFPSGQSAGILSHIRQWPLPSTPFSYH